VLAFSFDGISVDEALREAQLFDWAKIRDEVARLS
jgi:hypothetical protein